MFCEELRLTHLTSDIWGRKPILLAATGIFFLGSLLCGASTSIQMLIAGRAVQGMGGGGCIILVNICISDLFSMRYGFFLSTAVGLRLLIEVGIELPISVHMKDLFSENLHR